MKEKLSESKCVLMNNEVERRDVNLSKGSLLNPSSWREEYPLDSKKVKEIRVWLSHCSLYNILPSKSVHSGFACFPREEIKKEFLRLGNYTARESSECWKNMFNKTQDHRSLHFLPFSSSTWRNVNSSISDRRLVCHSWDVGHTIFCHV